MKLYCFRSVLHIGDLDLSSEIDCQSFGRGAKKCQPKHITSGFEEVIIHPQYNTRGKSSDDIALIRLNISIDFQTVEGEIFFFTISFGTVYEIVDIFLYYWMK